MSKDQAELWEWYFDDQAPVLAPSNTHDPTGARIYGLCASSNTGKLFIYSGYKTSEAAGRNIAQAHEMSTKTCFKPSFNFCSFTISLSNYSCIVISVRLWNFKDGGS